MSIKTKHKEEMKSTLLLKGNFPSCHLGNTYVKEKASDPSPEMELVRVGLWSPLTEQQNGVAHEDRWAVFKPPLCHLLFG